MPQRHQSPSYYRRQERRRAARQSCEQSDKVVAEQVATDSTKENAVKGTESEGNAAEATSNEKVAKELECDICDFRTNRATGLRIHMSRKHARIEQLDEDQFDEDKVRLTLWKKWGTTFRVDTDQRSMPQRTKESD